MTNDTHPPLAGIRVLDASRVLAGPFCGQILGDLGAEVIKVERPGMGDETREWGPPFLPAAHEPLSGGLSAYYLSCNRNKRAVTLDLAKKQGLDLFQELAGRSDVVLENFLAASANRLGLSAANLMTLNPRLIVCSISGFGRTGPLSAMPGYDFAIQGLSGLMSVTGPVEGPPYKVGVAVTDVITGLYAANAVLACLHARNTSGHGYAVDLALLDCALASQVNMAQAYLMNGKMPPRQGNAHLQIVPYQLFATANSWLILAVGNDRQWRRFCQAADRHELAEDRRFATNSQRVQNREVLLRILTEMIRERDTEAWESTLREAKVPHAPVWDYAALFSHPQAKARGLRVTVHDPDGKPLDLLGSPFHIAGTTIPKPTSPPRLGQDTEKVLQELLGLDSDRLAELRRQGVI
jgi:crotonobetainyl-CoA:carnitine CoA-transferase CaiB-like acyl-CoA transferase